MSKKSFKKEYIILGVLIVALLVYLAMRKTDKVNYQLPEMKPIAADTLTKIEITRPDGVVTLEQKDKKWTILPNNFPTDISKMKGIIDTVTGFRLTALASKAKNFSRYGLAKDKLIKVLAYNDKEVVREFNIGKVTATNNHTFVLLKDDTNVYHARTSFRRHFEQKVDDLRDKVVLTVDKNEVSEISLEKEGKVLALKKSAPTPPPPPPAESSDKKDSKDKADKTTDKKDKNDKKDSKDKKDIKTPPITPQQPAQTVWLLPDGKEASTPSVDGILNQIGDLRCDEYIDGKTEKDFVKPIYTLTIKGKKDYVLRFFPKIKTKAKQGDTEVEKYPVLSSETPYPFLLSTYKAEQLMKKHDDMLKK